MPTNSRLAIRLLYVLLFATFVGFSLAPDAARWLSRTYGGWSMLAGFVGYGAVIGGIIALINRLERPWQPKEPRSAQPAPVGDLGPEIVHAEQAGRVAETGRRDRPTTQNTDRPQQTG